MRASVKYILILAALAALAAGAYFYLARTNPSAPTAAAGDDALAVQSPAGNDIEIATTSVEVPAADATTYASTRYHFSLLYPHDLAVKEYDESDGAQTITFQRVSAGEASGFQLFVTPYEEPQVTQERFLGDEPSGVRDNLHNVSVDGATAAAFDSKNPALGDTYEIWIVHGGFLYELTTLKSLASLLDAVAATWKFTQ